MKSPVFPTTHNYSRSGPTRKTMPKISVIIPAYNVEQYIAAAIESVLAQSFNDFELIVIDDGSTDETATVVRLAFPQIRLTSMPQNSGLGATANHGISIAKGDFVVILGADDMLEPTYLEEMVAAFEADTGFVTCHCININQEGEVVTPESAHLLLPPPVNRTKKEWQDVFFHAGDSTFGVPMFRKSALQACGEFDDSYKQLAFLEMYFRLINKDHALKVVEKKLFRVRQRTGQMSAPTPAHSDQHVLQLDRIREKHYFKGRPMKVMIATPFYENKGYSPYIRSMFQTVYTLARHSKLEFDFVEVSGGSYIDNNRNIIANQFLESDCTHLFFIDSDESWNVEGFLNVLKADVDIVGAAYPVKNNWENYGVTIYAEESNGFRPVVNDKGLIKAEKVPTGFMKIHRRVFEKLRAANPDDWYMHGENKRLYNFFGHLTINHIRYGEDISFNIRWQNIGGELWVEPRVSMGHYGVKEWLGNYDSFLRKQPGGDLELKAA